MQRHEFESLVNEAVKELPEEFREKLTNVAIVIEDHPSEDLLERMEVPEDETLFGLYEGVPLTERGHFNEPLYPDRILIFQGPIEEECDTPEEVREEVLPAPPTPLRPFPPVSQLPQSGEGPAKGGASILATQ